MVEKARQPALKLHISDITKGRFEQSEGLKPAYILTQKGRRVGRARMLATIVNWWQSQDKTLTVITLDDGTDTIRVKAFGTVAFDKFKLGDIIELVGKPKYYNSELYIVPEVAWYTDTNSELLRELELRQQSREWEQKRQTVLMYAKQTSDLMELKKLCEEMGISAEDVEAILESQELQPEQEPGKEEMKSRILSTIESLDKGEGCSYGDLLTNSSVPEVTLDTLVQELLDDGTCFEPRPGKIRRVEK
jgi:RPA family protein